ncbi:MAG: hypothetical protein JO359_02915, partial [Candidatus Eremiobacteraeota bacterium]|nr:hypothetical protein [Candidatus Eremiobacteraeota bacterium]
MITALEPQPFEKRAFLISLALHCCGLALLAALVPLAQGTVGGRGMHDAAFRCAPPCAEVFALRIEHRPRAAPSRAAQAVSALPAPDRTEPRVAEKPVARRPQRTMAFVAAPHAASAGIARIRRTIAAPALVADARAISGSGQAGTTENVTVATQATLEPVASRVQPNTAGANPSVGVETASDASSTRGNLGPGNWGSHSDSPTLLDRALYDEVVATIGRRGTVVISVDDQGRATDVRFAAAGIDPALLDALRKRLLAARYA